MEALLKIQAELKAPKNQHNKFGNYAFRSAEDILEAVKPLLAKYDAQLTLSDELINLGNRYYVKATATLKHKEESETVTAYAREEENLKGMTTAQITGSTSSYSRKYALNGLFLIDDNKDTDVTNTQTTSQQDEVKKSHARVLKHINNSRTLEDLERCKKTLDTLLKSLDENEANDLTLKYEAKKDELS